MALDIFVIGNLLSFVSPGYRSFASARVIMAIGAGMVVVTALDIAAIIAAPSKQASAIATVAMGFTASLIIGVPLARIAAAQFGWKSVIGILALAGLATEFVLLGDIPRVQGVKPVPLSKQRKFLKNGNVALGKGAGGRYMSGLAKDVYICTKYEFCD